MKSRLKSCLKSYFIDLAEVLVPEAMTMAPVTAPHKFRAKVRLPTIHMSESEKFNYEKRQAFRGYAIRSKPKASRVATNGLVMAAPPSKKSKRGRPIKPRTYT